MQGSCIQNHNYPFFNSMQRVLALFALSWFKKKKKHNKAELQCLVFTALDT